MWTSTLPTTGTEIAAIASIFPGNWLEIENILGVEHYTFTSPLVGRHKPWKLPSILTAATSGISGIVPTEGLSGVLAFDTTIGQLCRYDEGTGWVYVNKWTLPCASVYLSTDAGDQNIPPSGGDIPFDVVEFERGTCYNLQQKKFTCVAAGYYWFNVSLSMVGIGGVAVYIRFVRTQGETVTGVHTMTEVLKSNNRTTVTRSLIINMNNNENMHIQIAHNRSTAIIVESGQTRTYMGMVRLS